MFITCNFVKIIIFTYTRTTRYTDKLFPNFKIGAGSSDQLFSVHFILKNMQDKKNCAASKKIVFFEIEKNRIYRIKNISIYSQFFAKRHGKTGFCRFIKHLFLFSYGTIFPMIVTKKCIKKSWSHKCAVFSHFGKTETVRFFDFKSKIIFRL